MKRDKDTGKGRVAAGVPGAPLESELDGKMRAADGSPPPPGFDACEARIAILAYYKSERRVFANAGELADWLDAERDAGDAAR